MLLCWSVSLATAQIMAPPPAQTVVRYHFGDDAAWANPTFDDSAWPAAQDGFVPSRSREGHGFLWIRVRVPVSSDLNAPRALHLTGLGFRPMAWQAWVNGQRAGGQGSFPPHPDPVFPPLSPVMDLPSSLAPPGSTALVALREWFAPAFFEGHASSRPAAVIDEARALSLAVRANAAETLVANGPEVALSAVLALVGLALLFFWRSSRSLEYLWAAIMLVSPLCTAVLSLDPVATRLSFHTQNLAWSLVYSAGLVAEIEFMWTIFLLRSRPLHILWHALWIAFILAQIGQAWFLQSPHIELFCRIVIVAGVALFDGILFPVCIREMFRRGGNRAFAAAMCLMEIIIALATFGYSVHVSSGPFTLDLFQVAVMLVDLAIAALLFRRAWKAWKESDGLRVEFEAAREVQERLVVAPPEVPGLRMEAAYIPATQVGGDFYHVRPDDQGGVLIVVGDVSGKGLRAAMAVAAIVGALRAMPLLPPSRVLFDLNRGLAGNLSHGFVTCCATHIAADGRMTIANAGHIPPYRNGVEMDTGFGLPLGIAPTTAYDENTFHLAPGDSLTFLTDGVAEARNAAGELFGFDRTRNVSTWPAREIASAAQAFGQQDDITVFTLFFAGARVARA